jgi:two-component system, chemotaxis family, chemotaxis protein CheY
VGFSVLIVDDSATIRAIIKRALTLAGLPLERVIEASDGKAALDTLEREHVDLILADLHMPVMSGVEMIGRLQADPKHSRVPVIVITAEPNQNTIHELRRMGVRAHLAKPFAPEAVRDAVAQVMGVPNAV